ncbi:suppressor protein SRP40 [Plutella xylostella]|nr:suppressor protein SRP40 [Plutella xylostella]
MASASRADIILSPEESSSSSSSSSSSESSASSREASPVRVADPPSSSSAKKSKKRKTEKERKPAAPAKKRSKKENTEKTSKKRDGTTKLKKENQVKAATQLESRPSTSLKTTAKDIMGVDSDIDEDLLNNGKKSDLISYFSRRVANGISKQTHPDLQGTHFIDLKLYMCSEIENVSPMNRWRHSIVTVKAKSNDDSDAWKYLIKFLQEIKKDFKDSPVTYVSSYNQNN